MGLCLHINVSMSITKKKKLLGKHLREQTEQNHSFTFCQKATSYRWWYNCICKVLPSHFFLVHGSLLPFYLFFCNLSIILSNTRLASHIGKFLMSQYWGAIFTNLQKNQVPSFPKTSQKKLFKRLLDCPEEVPKRSLKCYKRN